MKRFLWANALLLPLFCLAQTSTTPALNKAPADEAVISSPPISISASGYDSAIARVRDTLHLSEGQQALWVKYVEKIDAYNRWFYQQKPASAYISDIAPRQIGRMVDAIQNRLEAMEEIEGAAKKLYENLDSKQQKIADEILSSTVPVFSSSDAAYSSVEKTKGGKPDGTGARKRHGSGTGGWGQ